MNTSKAIVNVNFIQHKIFTMRGKQVMLDSDLAEMYGVELKRLNEQVKRNIERFPESFRFQLTKNEEEALKVRTTPLERYDTNLRSQIATSSEHGGRRHLPYVFTEQGVSMLSAVLRSETAIKVSIAIMNAFVEMRKFISTNASIFNRLDTIELKQLETDQKVENVLKALESKDAIPQQGVFFDGQIFDSYKLVSDIIRTAKTSVVLIDNYVDDSVLTIFGKNENKINFSVFTKNITKQLKLDAEKYNQQNGNLKVMEFDKSHDRFLIIDQQEVYHLGASLKDLGKKWFAFSKMDKSSISQLLTSILEMV